MSDAILCPFCAEPFVLDAWIVHMDSHIESTELTVDAALPLDIIRTDFGTQSRANINTGTVQTYAEDMSNGDQFPPLKVYYDRQNRVFVLVDGFHRLRAAKAIREVIQIETIAVDIYFGTVRDAVLASKGVNFDHGLIRTALDKRKVVSDMLSDSEWAKWSDREIGRLCHVSHTMVSKIRAELTPRVTGSAASGQARTYTRQGKPQSMNTSAISDANRTRTTPPPSQTLGKVEDALPPVDSDVDAGFDEDGNPIRTRPLPVNHFPSQPAASGSTGNAFIPVWQRGEPARPVPGMTSVDHYDPMSGAHPVGSNGRKAPVLPALLGKLPWTMAANGSYWDIRDAQEAVIYPGKVAGEQGQLIAQMTINAVNATLASSEPAPEPVDTSISFTQTNELGLNAETLTELIKTHGRQTIVAALRFLRECGKTPENPLEYFLSMLEGLGGKQAQPPKRKRKTKTQAPANPNHPFIIEILATFVHEAKPIDPDIYAKTTERNKAEKLHCAGIRPEHVQDYIRGLRQTDYWKDKPIDLKQILKGIIPWLNVNRPGWNKPVIESADFTVDDHVPKVIVPLDEAWKEQRTGS